MLQQFNDFLSKFDLSIDGLAFIGVGPDLFPGYEITNSHEETVFCDQGHHYHVNYTWLEQASSPIRIELMEILSGKSPAHEYPGIAHASFKLPSFRAYKDFLNGLQHDGGQLRQSFVSDYGLFSYWHMFEKQNVWLKPRVNLRDAS